MDGALVDPKVLTKLNLGFPTTFTDFLDLGSGHVRIMHIA